MDHAARLDEAAKQIGIVQEDIKDAEDFPRRQRVRLDVALENARITVEDATQTIGRGG